MLRNIQEICKVMEGLARNERMVSELYAACADKWPEDRDFWIELVSAEEKHAEMIESMAEIMVHKPDRFETGRPFNMAAIQSSMNWIQSNKDKVKSGALDKIKLLIIARDIEQSILEARFTEIVTGNDLEYSNLVDKVISDTQAHREILNRKISKLTP